MKRYRLYYKNFGIVQESIRSSFKTVLFIFLFAIWETSLFAQTTPSGIETQGNTTIENSQLHPKIAADTTGNFVLVWESFNEDGDDYGVFGQRFNNSGTKVGSQFQINATTNNAQSFPDVAMDENGNFTVVWMSEKEDGDGWGTYIRGYDDTGSSVFGPTLANTTTAGEQRFPTISTGGGNTVVTWMEPQNDGDIFARIFDSSGNPANPPFLVNTVTAGFQGFPTIAVDSAGNFVIAWQDNAADGDGIGIQAQRFDDTGSIDGTVISVNTTTTGNQQEPQVAKTQDGKFAVSWSSYGQDSDHFGVFARLFDNSGTALTSEILVNTETTGAQENESIVAMMDGKYAVSWSSYAQDSSFTGAYMQILNDDGSFYGSETRLNTTTFGFQHFSDLASSNAKLHAVWQDGMRNTTESTDGDDYGINFQLFSSSNPPVAVCQDITIYLDNSGSAEITGQDIDGGSTDDIGIASLLADPSSFTCENIGSNDVTLTVINTNGNVDTCHANVTVVDTVSPLAVCQNITIYLDISGYASIDATDLNGGSTDNCEIQDYQIIAGQTEFNCLDANKIFTVDLQVNDIYGNSSFCTSDVAIADTGLICSVPPQLPPAPADVTVPSPDSVPNQTDLTAVSSNCGGDITVSPVDSVIPGSCVNDFIILRTWTFVDSCGNSNNITQTITVIDTIVPIPPTPPADVYASCADDIPPPINLTAIDNNDGPITVGPTIQITPGSCPNDFVMIRTWTFADTCGNFSSVSQNIVVVDSVAPAAPIPPADLVLDCAADVPPPVKLTAIDNCDDSITVSPTIQITPGSCPNDFVMIRTWTFADTCGNFSSVSQTITVLDTLPPVPQAPPADLVLDCAAEVPPPVNLTATDNCGGEITVSPATTVLPGSCPNDFVMIRTWTFADTCGNFSSVSQTITVLDTIAPVIGDCPSSDFLIPFTNLGECYYTSTGDEFDISASDNCSSSLQYSYILSEATTGSGSQTLANVNFNAGVTQVSWTVRDECGNSSTCAFNINVNKISTISSVSVNPLSQQYSDSVEFTATITPWDCNDNNFIGGDVTFYIGNQPVGSPVNIQSDGTAIAKYPLIENPSFPSNGEMAPGNHLVTAMFNNYDIIYDVNDATTSIEITKENACYSYTGQLFASVGKNFEHNVYMAATIYDEMDGSQGDIRNSMARFVVSDAGIVYTSPWLEIGLVDPNDSTVGYISHNWIETVLSKTNTSEVYTVSVELSSDSYFELCSGEESVLTIYVPDGEFITGGGYLINNSPDGLFAADPDSKTNFGFNVKWNKQATNLQGKMNIIFRKTDGFGVKHIYQVKTNATNSLGIDVNNDCDSAEFVSKANLTDITNPLNPVSLGGNLELQVTLSDCSQNGEFDKMGISVWDNNGNLIYSSNWTGYETVKQVIEAGNIVIHSNSNLGTQSNAKKSAEILFPEFRSIDLKVYPNPFSEKLKFEFVSPEDTKSTVELYDITGRKISTVFEGQVKGNIKYNIEFVPTNAVSGMYLYKVIIGNTVYNGNVIYKKRF